MKSIEELHREHRAIERMLQRGLAALETQNLAVVESTLDFLSEVADRVHHKKEEKVLFEPLAVLAPGPVMVLQREHDQLRAFLSGARAALPGAQRGDPGDQGLLASALKNYAELVRAHMQKEDHILFPLAERSLGLEADERVMRRMAAVQAEVMTPEVYARWLAASDGRGAEPTRLVRASRRPDEGTSAKPPPERPPERAVGREPVPLAALIDARSLEDKAPSADTAKKGDSTSRVLYDDGRHKNIWLHDFGKGLSVQANQFLIVRDGQGMVLDPGGPKVYPHIYAETMRHLAHDGLKYVFLSHQDPDIGTSLNAWLMDTHADALISRLWVRFMAHFGIDRLLEYRLTPIPDEGMYIDLAGAELMILPAHFLHSPGNFQVYDKTSRTLFSGDLGAAVGSDETFVTDFDAHVASMRPFHRRYMASKKALQGWAEMVRDLDIDMIAPQHGGVFQGRDMVKRFIEWVSELECGVDLSEGRYRIPPRP